MELITTVFTQLRADINEKLNVAERQMIYLLKTQSTDSSAIQKLEARLTALETQHISSIMETPATQLRSGGLEGLLMKRPVPPSPILGPNSENSVIVPMIQRQHSVVLDERPVNVLESLARARLLEASTKHVVVEDTEVAVDDEVAYGEVVAEQGGIDSDDDRQLAEEEVVEEEVVEEEVVEEEEEVEELQLEEFAWKGKTYFKDQYNKVYRNNDDTPEDEPFAEYDEKNGKLVKIA
jgi:hypothetical protein